MEPLRYECLGEALIESFPELRGAYEVEMAWWGQEKAGAHVLYGNLLNPFIEKAIADYDEAVLKRIGHHLDLLAANQDLKIQEVMAFSVIEHFIADSFMLSILKSFLGSKSLKICAEVEDFWDRMPPAAE
jgi:hypothetical protein